uniref:Uncharacterized protein n=1 Tax=Parascaris univalens TaxID=6257 RepID=A0A914ZF26_PARUN
YVAVVCGAYSGNVPWNEVSKAHNGRYEPRSKAALAPKWTAIKKQRLTAQEEPSSSEVSMSPKIEIPVRVMVERKIAERPKDETTEGEDKSPETGNNRSQMGKADERSL